MTNPWIVKLVKETGKTEKEVTALWEKAKKNVAEAQGIEESEFTSEQYAVATNVVKSMSGLRELTKFYVESELSADEFIENVISGQFNVLQKDGLIKHSSKPKKVKSSSTLVPDLKNMEHSDEETPEEGEEMDWGDMTGGTAGASQAGDGGGVGGESAKPRHAVINEKEYDEDYNFDFLNDIEVE